MLSSLISDDFFYVVMLKHLKREIPNKDDVRKIAKINHRHALNTKRKYC